MMRATFNEQKIKIVSVAAALGLAESSERKILILATGDKTVVIASVINVMNLISALIAVDSFSLVSASRIES